MTPPLAPLRLPTAAVAAAAVATITMKGSLFLRRSVSVSELVISSTDDALRTTALDFSATVSSGLAKERLTRRRTKGLRGLARPRVYLWSFGLSPGRRRGRALQHAAAVSASSQPSSTISLGIHNPVPSLYSHESFGFAPVSLLVPAGVLDLSTRGGDIGGSKVKTNSPSPERTSMKSNPVPINHTQAVATAPAAAPAIATVGNEKGVTNPTAVLKTGATEEKEYVWANNYRPSVLEKFICNKEQANELVAMVNSHQCSHLIFEGPPGVGKKTMVLATLRDVFGHENIELRTEVMKFELKGEFVTSIDVTVRKSSRHVEVNLCDLHGYEKHVLVALMNEPHAPIEKHGECDRTSCGVVVVHDADKLSTDAQHYVSWLMEKYQGCCKIFFCCSEASKLQIIEPLCKIIKLQPPSDTEIIRVLKFIAVEESIDLPPHMAKRFAENSKNNLRQAIRSFEASWKSNSSVKENEDIITGWEDDIAGIARSIVEEQSPKQLYIIRGKLKNLIEHDVSPDFIFSTLIDELKKHLDNQLQAETDALYKRYKISPSVHHKHEDCGMSSAWKENIRYFMRIEEFIAKFMSFYKSIITKRASGPKR